MRVAVIGSGYVGAVAAACLASVGHEVVGVETDPVRLAVLGGGHAPFHEPDLDELIRVGLASGALEFSDDLPRAVSGSEMVVVCVGTPVGADGRPDTSAVDAAAQAIALCATPETIVVVKSTVPLGTGDRLQALFDECHSGETSGLRVPVVSSPEFLREGSAVHDFLNPDRLVIGGREDDACERVLDAFRPILGGPMGTLARPGSPSGVPVLRMSHATAEMTKHASNAFLAAKISFVNEIARLCDLVGADVVEVAAGMGADPRIGGSFLAAGIGWGGSCLGKDVTALITGATDRGYEPRMLSAVLAVNDDQRHVVVGEIERRLTRPLSGARVGVLGLTFKAGTDDLRDSPALALVDVLLERGALVTACDPMVSALAGRPQVEIVDDPRDVATLADAIVLATAWPEFLSLDLADLRRRATGRLLVDGRNALDRAGAEAAGFDYVGIGRGRSEAIADAARDRTGDG